MAERRMFAKSIVLSGRFMKLPPVTQLLYYRLGMEADDDGFHNAPEFTMRNCGATRKDMERLREQGFVHCFESGVVVLLHWRIHNFIRRDRYRQSLHTEELKSLIVSEKGEYLLVDQVDQVDRWSTQDRIGKDRSGEDRIGKATPAAAQPGNRSGEEDAPRLAEIMCYALEHHLQSDALAFYHHYHDRDWKEDGRPIRDWKRLLRKWEDDYAGTS